MALEVKNLPANAGEVRHVGWIPGSGRSPRGGDSNTFHSCLENPMAKAKFPRVYCWEFSGVGSGEDHVFKNQKLARSFSSLKPQGQTCPRALVPAWEREVGRSKTGLRD